MLTFKLINPFTPPFNTLPLVRSRPYTSPYQMNVRQLLECADKWELFKFAPGFVSRSRHPFDRPENHDLRGNTSRYMVFRAYHDVNYSIRQTP